MPTWRVTVLRDYRFEDEVDVEAETAEEAEEIAGEDQEIEVAGSTGILYEEIRAELVE